MGRFSGVLIASDFDNTLAHTSAALEAGLETPTISEENKRAIEEFMAEGGIFAVATGRSIPSFEHVRGGIPMNGPTILFNGAAIYDYSAGEYRAKAFLPETVRPHAVQLLADWPEVGCEVYHDDNSIQSLQPNRWTREHLHLTHSPTVMVESMDEIPSPISKILFEADSHTLEKVEDYIKLQSWGGEYEIVRSSDYLLEMTAKGATKGCMVVRLRELLGIAPENMYCIGDYDNDVDMLLASAVPFAPENAIEAIHHMPGVHILPPCWENTMVAMVEALKERYS